MEQNHLNSFYHFFYEKIEICYSEFSVTLTQSTLVTGAISDFTNGSPVENKWRMIWIDFDLIEKKKKKGKSRTDSNATYICWKTSGSKSHLRD